MHRVSPPEGTIAACFGQQSARAAMRRHPKLLRQLGEKRLLISEDLGQRGVEVEIGDPVDLGKALPLAGARRPFGLEIIAAAIAEIQIGCERKGMHGLAAFLLDRVERHELAIGHEAGLLGELAPRAGEEIARFHQPLRDRPRAGILLCPERTARMREQYLQAVLEPVGEDSSADVAATRHGENDVVTAVLVQHVAKRRAAEPPFRFTIPTTLRSGDDRDNPERAGLDDNDLIVHDEVEEATPRRMDFHDRGGHGHQVHRARHHRADADVEVHIRHPVDVAAPEHRFTDPRALLGVERRRAGAGLALAGLLLALAGLASLPGLPLLALALTRARLCLIAVLRGSALPTLASTLATALTLALTTVHLAARTAAIHLRPGALAGRAAARRRAHLFRRSR